MRAASPMAALAVLSLLAGACADESTSPSRPVEVAVEVAAAADAGGATTTFDDTTAAFARSAANLDADQRAAFAVGNAFFTDNWVGAPASAEARDGLGPIFNATSCSGCHLHDGRAQPPSLNAATASPGLVVKLSVPGSGAQGGPLPEPNYGSQFGDQAIPGVVAEGRVVIETRPIIVQYDDGTTVELAAPDYSLEPLRGPLADNVMISPRVAPAVFGAGLLEAIPEADLLAAADPNDSDGDGISGRANMVWDVESQTKRLGRFGWKAGQPSVRQQSAAAFVNDIGITSSVVPEEACAVAQADCLAAATGGSPELDDKKLDRVTFYVRTLGVPGRRDVDDEQVRRGADLFVVAQCAVCHTPVQRTLGSDLAVVADQQIQPFTDLLLHDMGPDLADGSPEFLADGTEWRTAPLWGIGLVAVVNGHTRFMHDGRARSIEEAILWHGGEAAAAQQSFRSFDLADRRALLAFLESL